jgi:nitrogen regulatory protein P-II 1
MPRYTVVRITCYIKPHNLEAVKSAIAALGVSGMSVSDVRGTGNSEETTAWFGGDESLMALPIRSRLTVVAPDVLQEEIVSAILESAQTGQPGDGKIFIERVQDVIRVRTQERGEVAV